MTARETIPEPFVSRAISGEPHLGRAGDGLHLTIPSTTTYNGPGPDSTGAAARLWEPLKKSWVCGLPYGPLRSLQTDAVSNQKGSSKAFLVILTLCAYR